MRKLTFFLFFFISILSRGQQTITDKLLASVQNGGAGVAYFTINYSAGNFQTKETDVISVNATDTNNIMYSVHSHIADTGKTGIDTTIVLSGSQVSMLNSFYQNAGNGTNPDPAISNAKTGASGTLIVSLCCADVIDVTYNTTIHISLGRYLLSYRTNWN